VGKLKKKEKRLKVNDLEAGTIVVSVDPKYFRPTEVYVLVGDATKTKEKLGWKPKMKFEELVNIIVKAYGEKVQRREFLGARV